MKRFEELKEEINSCSNEELGKIIKSSINLINNNTQDNYSLERELTLNLIATIFQSGQKSLVEVK